MIHRFLNKPARCYIPKYTLHDMCNFLSKNYFLLCAMAIMSKLGTTRIIAQLGASSDKIE